MKKSKYQSPKSLTAAILGEDIDKPTKIKSSRKSCIKPSKLSRSNSTPLKTDKKAYETKSKRNTAPVNWSQRSPSLNAPL